MILPAAPISPDSTVPGAPDITLSGKPAPGELAFRFTGSGSEYLRIWLVNLLLTVLTLGIYSAWAKVRREKFFHQNTRLAGASFDYHGRPMVILRGRLIAFALLALAQLDFVPPAVRGIATLLLLALLPLLMQRSLRFRLANTSYRGVRFSFTGTAGGAYKLFGGYLAAAALWLLVMGGLLSLVVRTSALGAALTPLLVLGLMLMFPMMHASWRRFATNHSRFGVEAFGVQLRRREFVWIYLLAVGVWMAGLLAVAAVFALSGTASSLFGVGGADDSPLARTLVFTAGLLLYATAAAITPIITARVQNLSLSRTRIGPHRLVSPPHVAAFVRLQLTNLVLTVITLGLYRPFAAVATARMRVTALSLVPDGSVDDILASIAASRDVAVGSEAMDLLGIDLSL